jgi:hypothetical protein
MEKEIPESFNFLLVNKDMLYHTGNAPERVIKVHLTTEQKAILHREMHQGESVFKVYVNY